jgi:hypothetical protein
MSLASIICIVLALGTASGKVEDSICPLKLGCLSVIADGSADRVSKSPKMDGFALRIAPFSPLILRLENHYLREEAAKSGWPICMGKQQ